MRLDQHIRPERRVETEEHRLGRDERRAAEHGRESQPALDLRLGLGKLGAVVDAKNFSGFGHDDGARRAVAPRHLDCVREIEFVLGVVAADRLQPLQRLGAVERHQAGVAKPCRALGIAGVLVLADGEELARGIRQKASVAARIVRLEAKRDHAGVLGSLFAQGRKGFWPHQRRVGENHENVSKSLRQSVAGRQHGMGGAAPLGLYENAGAGRGSFCFGGDIGAIGADNNGDMIGAGLAHGVEHMGEHGASSDLMQGFRVGRAHPLAFAGGQHDRQATLRRVMFAPLRRRHANSLVEPCKGVPDPAAGETTKV